MSLTSDAHGPSPNEEKIRRLKEEAEIARLREEAASNAPFGEHVLSAIRDALGESAEAKEIRHLKQEADIARLRAEAISDAPADQPIIWLGTQRELAAHIVDLHDKGKIAASSKRQAIIQTARHFAIKSEGGTLKAVNPESLWRNYYQQTTG